MKALSNIGFVVVLATALALIGFFALGIIIEVVDAVATFLSNYVLLLLLAAGYVLLSKR